MNFFAIFKRVFNLVTKPHHEWDKIKGEQTSIAALYLKYALIIYAIPSVAIWIVEIRDGSSLLGLIMAIYLYIFTLCIVFLMGVLINALGPRFGAGRDMVASQKLSVYSLTPYGFLGVLLALPVKPWTVLSIIILLSLYGIYFMYVGAPKIKNVSQDKLLPFIAIMGVLWILLLYFSVRLSSAMTLMMAFNSFEF